MDNYALTLSIGLLISLALYDWLGVSPGGMVVAGYMAYVLREPWLLTATLVAGLLTYLVLAGIGKFTILFGRRRFAVSVLIGLTVNLGVIHLISLITGIPLVFQGFGYVVPGLLALWFDKQGLIWTLSTLTIATTGTSLSVMFLRSIGV